MNQADSNQPEQSTRESILGDAPGLEAAAEELREVRERISETKRRLDEIEHRRNFAQPSEDIPSRLYKEEERLRNELSELRTRHNELAIEVEGAISTRLPVATVARGWLADNRLWIAGGVAFVLLIGFFVFMIESYLVMPRHSIYDWGTPSQRALISPKRLGNLDEVEDMELILNTSRGQRLKLQLKVEFQQLFDEIQVETGAEIPIDLPLIDD